MAKGYVIAHGDVSDLEEYKKYQAANAEPISKFGGRFLVRGGTSEGVEGRLRSRHVVLEFPSYQAALDFYHSDLYTAARALREPVSTLDMIVVEGYDGPQPGN